MALDVRCAWRLDGRGAGGSEQGEHGELRRASRASGRSPGRTIPVMNEVFTLGHPLSFKHACTRRYARGIHNIQYSLVSTRPTTAGCARVRDGGGHE